MLLWIEVGGGILAALVGVAVAATILALGGAGWAAALVALGGLGSGLAAYQHLHRHEGQWVAILWVSFLTLMVMTILGAFSVGIFLLPGTLASLVAAGVATWRSAADGAARE